MLLWLKCEIATMKETAVIKLPLWGFFGKTHLASSSCILTGTCWATIAVGSPMQWWLTIAALADLFGNSSSALLCILHCSLTHICEQSHWMAPNMMEKFMGHALSLGQWHNKHAFQLHGQSACCVPVSPVCAFQVWNASWSTSTPPPPPCKDIRRREVLGSTWPWPRVANFRHLGFAKMLILAVSHSFHLTISWRHNSLKLGSVFHLLLHRPLLNCKVWEAFWFVCTLGMFSPFPSRVNLSPYG